MKLHKRKKCLCLFRDKQEIMKDIICFFFFFLYSFLFFFFMYEDFPVDLYFFNLFVGDYFLLGFSFSDRRKGMATNMFTE